MKKNILKLSLAFLVLLSACNNQSYILPDTSLPENQKFIMTSIKNTFDEYDVNKDNVIDLSELGQATEAFNALDANKDKKITFDEVQPSAQRIQQMSLMIDNFYNDLYKRLALDNHTVSAKALSSSQEMEPFAESETWKKDLDDIIAKNADKPITQEQFAPLMNKFFLDLSDEQQKFKATGFWKWLKEKFRKGHDEIPLAGKKPVILVQGYAEPSWYFLYGIYRNLKKSGREVYPVNLFPNIGDITLQAKIVATKIEQIKKEQGVSKVDYVAHSMGGLIGRYYIQELKGENSIDHYVSIATPHYGTYVAWLGIGEGAKQMRPDSDFLKKLNEGNPLKPNIKYTSIWTKTDEIVIPSSSSVLIGSNVMPDIKLAGHLLILWSPTSYSEIREALDK